MRETAAEASASGFEGGSFRAPLTPQLRRADHDMPFKDCSVRRSASFDDCSRLARGRGSSLSRDVWLKNAKANHSPSSLAKFVNTHQNDFPMSVEVKGGSQPGVAVGTIYSFHFIKSTRVVHVQDNKGADLFSIPLNSSVQIGIVYPPILNSDNQICGDVTFKGGKELMAADPLPKIVRAVTAHADGNPVSSVAENELLIVKNIRGKSRPFGRQTLLVYSVDNNSSKMIRENCSSLFATRPEHVLVYPVEFFAHYHDELPLKSVLKFDSNQQAAGDNPTFILATEVVTLASHGIARSVIATPHSGKLATAVKNSPVLEIPVDADVEVEKASIAESEELCAESLAIIRDFDPTRVSLCATPTNQKVNIRHGYEKIGLELESTLLQRRPAQARVPEMEGAYSTPRDSVDGSNTIPHPVWAGPPNHATSVKRSGSVDVLGQLNALQRAVEIMQSQVNSVEGLSRKNNTIAGLLKAEIAQITKVTQQLMLRMDALLPPGQQGVPPQMAPAAAPQVPVVPPTDAVKDKNKEDLARLSSEEVNP